MLKPNSDFLTKIKKPKDFQQKEHSVQSKCPQNQMDKNLHEIFTTEMFVGCVVASLGADHDSSRLEGALAKNV